AARYVRRGRSPLASGYDERRLTLDRRAAALDPLAHEREVDPSLAVVLVTVGDLRRAAEAIARPHLLPELHFESADVRGPEPVGHERREDPGLEHPDREHRGETGRSREL